MASPAAAQSPFRSPEVRVVEASAGSGKTYALAKRYVQLVLKSPLKPDQVPIRQILALTFTNKAAFEMKERILEFLKLTALKRLKPEQEEDIIAPLRLSRERASAKAFAVMDGVIRHYNFFQVQTIDKFINALLSGCAFKLGLTANFKIKTTSADYLQYSLDELLDKAHGDKKVLKVFNQFLRQYLYLENRSGWFPKKDIQKITAALFEQSNTYGRGFRKSAFSYDSVMKAKRQAMAIIKKMADQLPEKTDARFVKSLRKFLAAHDESFDIDNIPVYFNREAFPVNKGGKTSWTLKAQWERLRELLADVCLGEAFALFDPYIDLFAHVMTEFTPLAARDDCLFLNELNKRAGVLFDDDGVTVEELYYRLATRFRHYLIDEFQDTSRLQWHNLRMLAEEALATGGTLFYVGDRKQAIYEFRGGDVKLFDDVREGFRAFNPSVELLTNNWRSQKQIVAFNNAVFAPENLTRFIRDKEQYETEKNKDSLVALSPEDIVQVGRIFESAKQTFEEERDGGYVCMELIDGDKKEGRDAALREKLVNLIEELKMRFTYRDIALLTRGNREIQEITAWLLEAGIPVESERTADITENALIRELAAFLRFLNSPIDNNAFTEFILGDLFARASGLDQGDTHAFVLSLRERLRNERDFYVYTAFRQRYPKVWHDLIDEFFSNVGLYPLYELAVTVYKRFKVMDLCPQAQGFFMHFLELIKKNEDEFADLQSFLQYFEELEGEDLYVHFPDSDAVKILTVHKAKGLEFPVVILPSLGMDIQIGRRSGEYQPKYVIRPQEDGLELMRVKGAYRKFAPELDAIYNDEYKKAFLNELNNVYVALTRPRCELYGFIPQKIGKGANIIRFLIPEAIYTLGKQGTYKDDKRPSGVSEADIPPADYPDWIDYLKDEFLTIDDVSRRDVKLKGEVMHFILQHVGNLDQADKNDILARALDEAARQYPQITDLSDFKRQVQSVLESKALRPFFYCGDDLVLTEQEVINRFGHTKRCDRLIVGGDEVRIVDYKSSRAERAKDFRQVNEYQDILRDVYPKREIKGYVIYLDTCEAAEV